MEQYSDKYYEEIDLLHDDEINDYIEHRLSELKNKEEKEIGLETDTSIYSGFLDEKIRVNSLSSFRMIEDSAILCIGSIIFDDHGMYKYLIEEVKRNDEPLVAAVTATDRYLGLDIPFSDRVIEEYTKERTDWYRIGAYNNEPINIEKFHRYPAAMCSECAGVVHNMLRFLDIKTDLIFGYLDGTDTYHVFNLIQNYFYCSDSIILLDASRKQGRPPLVAILDKEEKDKLYSFDTLTLPGTAFKNELSIYGFDDCRIHDSHEYTISNDLYTKEPDYKIVGINNKKQLLYKRI